MATRRVLIVAAGTPVDATVLAQAAAAGAPEIIQGIPPALSAIGITSYGVHDIVETDPPASALSADEKLAAAAEALAALDDISAPVLPVDVLDILTDLRSALEA